MEEGQQQNPQSTSEDLLAEATPTEKDERKARREKRNNVLIFVFLGVMLCLMIGAIAFVIYVCGGTASGCNCGQC